MRSKTKSAAEFLLAFCCVALAQIAGASTADASLSGRALYEPCRRCHGDAAQGSADGAAPAIAGQHLSYLMQQMMDYQNGARVDASENLRMHYTAMQTWSLRFDQGVVALAKYLAQLPVPAQTSAEPPAVNERAQSAFLSRCAKCHGVAGQGNGKRAVPRIAGQHAPYLAAQLKAFRQWHRLTPGTDMSSPIGGLSDRDLNELADFISRLPARAAREK